MYKNGINYEQFCDEINKKLEDRNSEDSIERSFAYFVENSDRMKINANDVKRMADEVGEELTEDQAKRIINRVGKNGKDADLNNIDTSEITDMEQLFVGLDPHNIDISEWNMENVKNIQS